MRVFHRVQQLLVIAALLCACPAWSQTSATRAEHFLKSGMADLKAGRFNAAEAELRSAAQLDGANPEIYNLLGFICDQTNRAKQAVQYYEKALAIDPDFTAARNDLGSVYLREGYFTLAVQQFKATIQFRPHDTTANYNLGLIYLDQGKYDQAARYFNIAHLASPTDPGVLLNLTRAYFAEGRKEDALRTAAEFKHTVGRNPEALFRMGIVLLINRQYLEAVNDLIVANQATPATPTLLLALAQAELQAGQDEAALKSVDQFIGLLKASSIGASGTESYLPIAEDLLRRLRGSGLASSMTQFLLGETQFLRREYALAIQTLTPLGQQYKDNPDYLNVLSMCYAELNQFPQAVRAVNEAIHLEPKRAEFYFNLASIYQKAGQSQAAIAILDRVPARDQSSPLILFSLGVSYFNLGNYTAAMRSLASALRLKPDFPQAEFFMARCYVKLDKPLKAIPAYQKALALDPTFYQAYYQLALLELRLGRASQAVPLLQQVVRLNPSYPDAHYELGKIYEDEGHVPDAVRELEDAVTLNPSYDAAYYHLGRLYKQLGETSKAREMFRVVTANQQKKLEAYQQKVSDRH
jgi:tetratricopeptide (TPR) repeat protein